MCTIEGNAVACGAAGTKGDGQSCGTSASDQCAGGFVCVQASPTASQCLEFCDADSECNAPGGLCLLELNDGLGGSIPNVTLCTPNCSPVTNAGCPSGSGCALLRENGGLMRWLTLCGPVGVKTQGQSCNPNAASPECAATYACIDDGTGSKCLRYCDVNAPNCGGLFCAQLQDNSVPPQPITLGAVTFGACL